MLQILTFSLRAYSSACLLLLGCVCGLTACSSILPVEPREIVTGEVQALRPMYLTEAEASTIGPFDSTELVFSLFSDLHLGSLLLGVDTMRGLRINRSRGRQMTAQGLGLLPVPGITRVDSFVATFIAVSNFRDQVIIDLQDPANPIVVFRNVNFYPSQPAFPRWRDIFNLRIENEGRFDSEFPFECPHPDSGHVGAWILDTLQSPECLSRTR